MQGSMVPQQPCRIIQGAHPRPPWYLICAQGIVGHAVEWCVGGVVGITIVSIVRAAIVGRSEDGELGSQQLRR